jgi:hypothetical protein
LFAKEYAPIKLKLEDKGSIRFFNELFVNAYAPIDVTLAGILTDEIRLLLKALLPIAGMDGNVSLLILFESKAKSPMRAMEADEKLTSEMRLCANAPFPMEATPEGSETLVSQLPLKEFSPMTVSEAHAEKSTDVRSISLKALAETDVILESSWMSPKLQ